MLLLAIKHYFLKACSMALQTAYQLAGSWEETNFPAEISTHLNLQMDLQRWKIQRCINRGRTVWLTITPEGIIERSEAQNAPWPTTRRQTAPRISTLHWDQIAHLIDLTHVSLTRELDSNWFAELCPGFQRRCWIAHTYTKIPPTKQKMSIWQWF